ncbi:MAG TPA: GNAT family N-acetyltransferase, partial [Candidatus Thermoplasmatota archaeon]|nr:GNAT family N-acetyltransferase [Candidatus Thermoplasmatota archaeon]
MPRIRVRRATARDLDWLVEHRRKMWVDMGELDPATPQARAADRVYRRWARAKLRQRHRFLGLIAERDGRVVGGGCVWVMDTQPNPWNPRGRTPYLLSMYTHPDARGEGVASAIVEAAIAWAKAEGHHVMRLHASRLGRGVYARFGFERSWE